MDAVWLLLIRRSQRCRPVPLWRLPSRLRKRCGYDIVPEIMIPLIGEKKELKFVKDIVVEVAEQVKKEKGSDIQYHIGTMIEIPRAALTAGRDS